MFKRVLIGTDLKDGLYRFAQFIPSLAASGLKQIVFLHTVPFTEEATVPRENTKKIDAAKAKLAAALDAIPEGVEVKVEVVSANSPDRKLIEVAKREQSDLIILGSDTRSLLAEKAFGSTSIRLCEDNPIPLMILRPQLISTYTREELSLRSQHLFRYLLIPYDGSESSQYLLQRLKAYAQNRPENSLQQCLLLHVLEDKGRKELQKEDRIASARQELERVKAELETLGLEVKTEVRQGEPLIEALEMAIEEDISAIATGSAKTNKFLQFSVPSLGYEFVRRSWFPVIYFPPS